MTPQSTSLLGLFLAGIAAIAFQIALGAVLIALALPVPWIAVAFLMGVPLGIFVTRSLPGLAFPAICLLALTGVAPGFVVDVPLWGQTAALGQTGDIAVDAAIAGYVAPGWRIDAERASDERLTSGRGQPYGYRRLAPLLSDTWTSGQPVQIWVAGEIRDSGRILPSHPQFWKEPGGQFARFVGTDIAGAQLAAGRAAQKFNLRTTPELMIVIRVASVAQAITDQYWALASAARFPVAAWALILGIAAAVLKWRTRLPAEAKPR